jgi:hypothetical protein
MYQKYNNKYLKQFFKNDFEFVPPKGRNTKNLNIMGNNSYQDMDNVLITEGVEQAQRYLTEYNIEEAALGDKEEFILEEINHFKPPQKASSKIIKNTGEKISSLYTMDKYSKPERKNSDNGSVVDLRGISKQKSRLIKKEKDNSFLIKSLESKVDKSVVTLDSFSSNEIGKEMGNNSDVSGFMSNNREFENLHINIKNT